MAIRRTLIPTVILAAFIVLSLPAMVAAQNNSPWWQNRGRQSDNYNRYQRERLRNSARRISDLSRQFERDLDRALDRSRIDGSIREDRINDVARDFRFAADNLRNSLGYGRDLNSSTDEARNLLQLAARIDRMMSRLRLNSRSLSDWSQIRQELRVISDAFNFNGSRGRWPY
jgi:hypothetical protein